MYKDVAKNIEIFKIKYPKTIVPSPSDTDYSSGFIRRYFVRKSNDMNGHIFEIDKDTYSEYLNNPFWIVGDLKWRIRGPIQETYKDNGEIDDIGVRNSNKASINIIASTLKNVGLYLPNLLQFHK
jgi:hypothetical protein